MLTSICCLVALAATDGPRAPLPGDSAAGEREPPCRVEERATLVHGGAARGQVVDPAGVAADAFGRLWVSDAALHRVQRFERDGSWAGETGALGSRPGEMRRPGAVVPLGTLSMAVLDRENRRVQTYDLQGRLLGTALDLTDPLLESRVGRVDPAGLAADRGGALYVLDSARERVLAFDFAGEFLRAIGGSGTRAGLLRGLRGAAAAPNGELVVAERVNARVQRLDAGGRVVASWPLPVARGPWSLPVAVDERGRVAVADEAGGRLWVFEPDGRVVAALDGLGGPRALVFTGDDMLVVAEGRPARVRRLAVVPRDLLEPRDRE